jgi:hypothetical protein
MGRENNGVTSVQAPAGVETIRNMRSTMRPSFPFFIIGLHQMLFEQVMRIHGKNMSQNSIDP